MKTLRRRVRVQSFLSSDIHPGSNGSNGAENGAAEPGNGVEGDEPVTNGAHQGNGATAAMVVAEPEREPAPESQPAPAEAPEPEPAALAGAAPPPALQAEPEPQPETRPAAVAVAAPPSVPAPAAAVSTPALPKKKRKQDSAPVQAAKAAPAPAKEAVATKNEPATRARALQAAQAPEKPVTPEPVAAPSARWRLFLTYQNLFWVGLFLLTIATRFWDLGPRAIHHDESLHSHFSDMLYIGQGYHHDPMMHGPLQFHLIAFMFWLFGASDATARFASVFCGIFVVMSPFFLRKQMGQIAAMVCAFLLFISPSILYFSRMAREDSIYSGMEMLMIVGLWRFLSTRRAADFVIFCAGLSLMFTIKETSYLMTALMAIFFLAVFAVQAGYVVLATTGVYVAALGGMFLLINSGMKAGTIPGLPNIPQTDPPYDVIMAFAGKLLTHPLVWGAALLTVLYLAVVTVVMFVRKAYAAPVGAVVPRRSPSAGVSARGGLTARTALPSRRVRPEHATTVEVSPNGHATNGVEGTTPSPVAASEAESPTLAPEEVEDAEAASPLWDPRAMRPAPGSVFEGYEPGSIPYVLGSLFSRWSVVVIGFVVAATIFTVFYTVFFTDIPHGIMSGLFGSLGYWMAQQDVARGGQPWYYYFLLVPLYEPVAVLFSLAAAVFFSWRGIRWLTRRELNPLAVWIIVGSVLAALTFGALLVTIVMKASIPLLGWLVLLAVWVVAGALFARSLLSADTPWRRFGPGYEDARAQWFTWFNTNRPVPFSNFSAVVPLFVAWWLLGATAIYSWAGEKMPWLMEHITRPAVILASLFVSALLVSIFKHRRIAAWWSLAPALATAPAVAAPAASPALDRGKASGVPAKAAVPTRQPTPGGRTGGKQPGPSRIPQPPTRNRYAPQPYRQLDSDALMFLLIRLALEFVAAVVLVLLLEVFFTVIVPAMRHQQGGDFFPSLIRLSAWVPLRLIAIGAVFLAIELVRSLPSSKQAPPWVAWSKPGSRFPVASYLTIFVVLTISWGLLMNGLTYKQAYDQWGFTWVFPLLIVLVTAFYAVWIGPIRSLKYLAVGILSVGLVYQFKSAIGLSYDHPDVATELAVYVQTTPDVTRSLQELAAYSKYATGGLDLHIMYDDTTSWPMEWYLRDYKNKTFVGSTTPNPGPDVKAMFLDYDRNHDKPALLKDYVQQRYAMRWWFPEDWYKSDFMPGLDPNTSPALEQLGSAFNTVRATVMEPSLQASVWKYLTFRQTPKPLGSTDMILFIRKDVVQAWHRLQYDPPSSTDLPCNNCQAAPPFPSSEEELPPAP